MFYHFFMTCLNSQHNAFHGTGYSDRVLGFEWDSLIWHVQPPHQLAKPLGAPPVEKRKDQQKRWGIGRFASSCNKALPFVKASRTSKKSERRWHRQMAVRLHQMNGEAASLSLCSSSCNWEICLSGTEKFFCRFRLQSCCFCLLSLFGLFLLFFAIWKTSATKAE